MALLFSSVKVKAWRGALGAKIQPWFYSWCPEWGRLLLFQALVVLVLFLSSNEKWIRISSLLITPFGFMFVSPFCHPNPSPLPSSCPTCCSLFLVFLCEGWIFSKKLQIRDFRNAQKESHQQRVCERKADRHTYGGKTPQGFVPILYMYNKLRCF